MISQTLTPRLTPLDRRVLEVLPEGGRAMRAGEVAGLVFGKPRYECEECHRIVPTRWGGERARWLAKEPLLRCRDCWERLGIYAEPTAMLRHVLIATPEDTQTTREILHGLHRVGLLQHGRGGWWRRT